MLKRTFFVNWYADRGRQFPWRAKSTSPFALLVTEMLLRQTKASGVEKLWDNLIRKYPDATTMAKANPHELRRLISVLGFGKMRARALISAARWLIEKHDGAVPQSLEALLKIPHIGAYSAHAVLCFGFGHKIEIVDTNVVRFFSRHYGLRVKPDIRRNPNVVRLARESLPREKKNASLHNYGILDFTAEVCRSVGPRCEICPLASSCRLGKGKSKKVQLMRSR